MGGLLTVMVKVCGAEVSTPPLAVPPLSCATIVTVATPYWPVAGVYVSVPFALTAGCDENSGVLLLFKRNWTVCPLSSAGPGLMFVTQPGTVWAPAFFWTS